MIIIYTKVGRLTQSLMLLLFITLLSSHAFALDEKGSFESIRKKDSVSFAFGSCINKPSSNIWQSIVSKSPDFFILLGDTLYLKGADWQGITVLRDRYNLQFNEPNLSSLIHQIPTFAIWDDHDFGPDNSDSRFPYIGITKQAFREFWANPAPPIELLDSISFKLDLDLFDLIMTDNRSFRVNTKVQEPGVYFGSKQINWITEQLRSTKKQLVIIASGNQVLTYSGRFENMGQYPVEREALFKAIEQSSARVMFISGDIHRAQILRRVIGKKEVVEITSSPLTANPVTPSDLSSISNSSEVYIGNNFGLIDVKKNGQELAVVGRVFDKDGVERLAIQY
jgi:alkaline phosphatase D